MPKQKEKWDGSTARTRRQINRRKVFNGGQNLEKGLIYRDGKREKEASAFQYKLLAGRGKELVDWLYAYYEEDDFNESETHQGHNVEQVVLSLSNEEFPDKLDSESLFNWIESLEQEKED